MNTDGSPASGRPRREGGSGGDPDRERFLCEAVRLAVHSVDEGGGPFGAVVVKDGEIIARGTNRVTAEHDPTAHAEIVAIRNACRRLGTFQLAGCEVYASTEPCPMCMGALYWARPARVFYASGKEDAAAAGFDDQFIYDELSRTSGDRGLPIERLPTEEAGAEFAAWRENTNRIEY
ncbi:MAG: nucleoside deaminase [Gemmatimonadota bacterium]